MILIINGYQAAQGINFLHQATPPIIHCDIKSHNVFLDDKWCARIGDFGITKINEELINNDSNNEQHALGTIYWTAPEVLNGGTHTTKSDGNLFFMFPFLFNFSLTLL